MLRIAGLKWPGHVRRVSSCTMYTVSGVRGREASVESRKMLIFSCHPPAPAAPASATAGLACAAAAGAGCCCGPAPLLAAARRGGRSTAPSAGPSGRRRLVRARSPRTRPACSTTEQSDYTSRGGAARRARRQRRPLAGPTWSQRQVAAVRAARADSARPGAPADEPHGSEGVTRAGHM